MFSKLTRVGNFWEFNASGSHLRGDERVTLSGRTGKLVEIVDSGSNALVAWDDGRTEKIGLSHPHLRVRCG